MRRELDTQETTVAVYRLGDFFLEQNIPHRHDVEVAIRDQSNETGRGLDGEDMTE